MGYTDILRGKDSTGKPKALLINDDGKLEVATDIVIQGDTITIDVSDVQIGNWPESQTIDGTVTVGSITNKVNIDTCDVVSYVNTVDDVANVQNVEVLESITNPVTVDLIDEYGWQVEYSPQGEMRVVTPTKLVGTQHEGNIVDPNFLTFNVGTGGSATQANGILTMAVGTTDGNTIAGYSVRKARYVSGNTNRYRTNRAMDVISAGTKRRWGMYEPGNGGAYFELDGTALYVVTQHAGTQTRVAQADWNGDKTFTMDTNYHTYEIYVTNLKAYFSINGTLVHTVTATSSLYTSSLALPIYSEIINASGTTNDRKMYITNTIVHRLGPLMTEPTSKYVAGAATTVCKYSPGKIQRLVFSAGATGNTVTFYDATSATGTPLLVISGTKDMANSIELQIPFHTALTMVTVGASSYATVIYE